MVPDPGRHITRTTTDLISGSFSEVVLQTSTLTKIRQLTHHTSNSKAKVDGFVWELTSAK